MFSSESEENMEAAVQMATRDAEATDVVAAVRRILSVPESELDYGEAKLALDRLIDPSIDVAATMAEIDRLAATARLMAGPDAGEARKLNALRRLIYVSGPWNEYRPFAYDHSNIKGANVRVKLISHYLATRRGVVGGLGFSIHRDGSINADRYFGYGLGVGATAGGGFSIDNRAAPAGSSHSRGMSGSVGPVSADYSRAGGWTWGINAGPGRGWMLSGTDTFTRTTQLTSPIC